MASGFAGAMMHKPSYYANPPRKQPLTSKCTASETKRQLIERGGLYALRHRWMIDRVLRHDDRTFELLVKWLDHWRPGALWILREIRRTTK
jgi:hypothetical protein